jgi:sulfur-oxidizing protein SoxY
LFGLASAALAVPRALLAAWPQAAFKAPTASAALAALAPGVMPEHSDRVELKAPLIAENGAVVPISISTDIDNVSRVAVIIEKNPSPFAASFELSPASIPEITLRFKMNETSTVMAVVEAHGQIYTASREVQVTLGGCSG